MKDNALKYCTTTAFSAAMLAFALSGVSRMRDAGDILGFCLIVTSSLWLIACFGTEMVAGICKLRAARKGKAGASPPKSPPPGDGA